MSKYVLRFEGEYQFLSNFSYHGAEFEGGEYPTVEHAFQAAKTLDKVKRHLIMECSTPSEAKRMGRVVDLRPGWDTVRVGVMRQLLESKFANPDLRKKLLHTKKLFLVEGNSWHDQFWGDCGCRLHQGDRGQNMLGMLLMELRTKLKGKK